MSMISIEVRHVNLAALNPDRLRAALRDGLQTAGGLIAVEMKSQVDGPFGPQKKRYGSLTSLLVNSIHVRQDDEHSITIAPRVHYAEWVEKGRKPGKLPSMWHGSDFMEWVRLRVMGGNITSKKRHASYLDAAWGIGFAIKMRGIKPNPFVARTAEKTREQATTALRIALAKALT
ncbi:HK97 gp10 family phage protein [Deefgea piscis]|uniref:HK97 gp10 family phage protein n=1 Tax=Deefgea piscis TaxID=2739061 RepID=UPI001C81D9EB|nr:hypothetical protein [Deefgea piscis]QZA80858.1 hypothetical protein K4H25_15410 [Deefgea piscis]